MTGSIADLLRTELRAAMRARDRLRTGVLREALAAIDNAGAVPLTDEHRAGAIEHTVVGRSADVARRELTEDEVRAVVRREADERFAAAAQVRAARPEQAEQLAAGAAVLTELLGGG